MARRVDCGRIARHHRREVHAFKRRFRLPSPALVISTIALALALGGTAVAAAVSGDTKADTKLVKKLAPTLSVKSAGALASVTYVNGNTVDAPPNGESDASVAVCPAGTVIIGGSVQSGGEFVEVSDAGLFASPNGGPINAHSAFFDNLSGTDHPTNFSTAICAKVLQQTVSPALRKASRR